MYNLTCTHYFQIQLANVPTESSVWLAAPHSTREEWRCALEESGVLCVVIASGVTQTQKSCADNWDLTQSVRCGQNSCFVYIYVIFKVLCYLELCLLFLLSPPTSIPSSLLPFSPSFLPSLPLSISPLPQTPLE